jgi:hypothetical protein
MVGEEKEDVKDVIDENFFDEDTAFFETVVKIYEMYLKPGALEEVNINAMVSKGVTAGMKELYEFVEACDVGAKELSMVSHLESLRHNQPLLVQMRDVFNKATKEILFLIEQDSFRRFTKSPLFEVMQAEAEAEAAESAEV